MAGNSVTSAGASKSGDHVRPTSKALTIGGIVFTVFVVSLMVAGIVLQILSKNSNPAIAHMRLNEWGDFLSGGCSLIAATWLIIGYFQQNRELRLMAKAIDLQGQELHNQVEETRQLVQSSIRHADAAEQAVKPRLVGKAESWIKERSEWRWNFENEGAPVTLLGIAAVAPLILERPSAAKLPLMLNRGEPHSLTLRGGASTEWYDNKRIRVTYRTSSDQERTRALMIVGTRMVEVPDETETK